MTEPKPCEHDFENAIRKGRAHWVCPKCQADITMILFLMLESVETNKAKQDDNHT